MLEVALPPGSTPSCSGEEGLDIHSGSNQEGRDRCSCLLTPHALPEPRHHWASTPHSATVLLRTLCPAGRWTMGVMTWDAPFPMTKSHCPWHRKEPVQHHGAAAGISKRTSILGPEHEWQRLPTWPHLITSSFFPSLCFCAPLHPRSPVPWITGHQGSAHRRYQPLGHINTGMCALDPARGPKAPQLPIPEVGFPCPLRLHFYTLCCPTAPPFSTLAHLT